MKALHGDETGVPATFQIIFMVCLQTHEIDELTLALSNIPDWMENKALTPYRKISAPIIISALLNNVGTFLCLADLTSQKHQQNGQQSLSPRRSHQLWFLGTAGLSGHVSCIRTPPHSPCNFYNGMAFPVPEHVSLTWDHLLTFLSLRL